VIKLNKLNCLMIYNLKYRAQHLLLWNNAHPRIRKPPHNSRNSPIFRKMLTDATCVGRRPIHDARFLVTCYHCQYTEFLVNFTCYFFYVQWLLKDLIWSYILYPRKRRASIGSNLNTHNSWDMFQFVDFNETLMWLCFIWSNKLHNK